MIMHLVSYWFVFNVVCWEKKSFQANESKSHQSNYKIASTYMMTYNYSKIWNNPKQKCVWQVGVGL